MEAFQTTVYQIADIRIRLNTLWVEERSNAFVPFVQTTEGSCDWEVTFRPMEQKFQTASSVLFKNEAFKVISNEQGVYIRQYYNDKFAEKNYVSVTFDEIDKKVYVTYLPEAVESHLGSDKLDFFYIALEKILLEENAMILHAACVDTPYGGILFSGVSGAGKSTQADLWCKYGKGRLINGDRPILKKASDGWRAYGSPYAGSSGCHLSESCPIRAIVLPKKSENCAIKSVHGAEKFRKVFGNLTLNMWDTKFVTKAGDLVQQLIAEIPVYELQCTMEKEAVLVLQELLEKEREQWNKKM